MNASPRRLAKFQPSLTLALQGLVAARRAQGLPVYDFGLDEAKGMLDPSIRDAGERVFREETTMYSEPAGARELREAVLRWLDVDDRYGPENVVISTGAKQCLLQHLLPSSFRIEPAGSRRAAPGSCGQGRTLFFGFLLNCNRGFHRRIG